MATIRGCLGVIEIGSAPVVVGELTAYSVNPAADEIDTSSMGSCTASSQAGYKKTTGTMTANYDPDDAGQLLFVVGTTQPITVYPEGKGSGLVQWVSTDALILGVNLVADVNGVVTFDMNYTINGEFTISDQT